MLLFRRLSYDPDPKLVQRAAMDSLQTLFQAAMADLMRAHKEEQPLWEEIGRLGSANSAWVDMTELADRWYEKRQVTLKFFERQSELAKAIRDAGGIPSVSN